MHIIRRKTPLATCVYEPPLPFSLLSQSPSSRLHSRASRVIPTKPLSVHSLPHIRSQPELGDGPLRVRVRDVAAQVARESAKFVTGFSRWVKGQAQGLEPGGFKLWVTTGFSLYSPTVVSSVNWCEWIVSWLPT
jgi:hypothetical protein